MKKLTLGFVKNQFEKDNWTLKSAEYVDAHRKLDCICPKGHECSITWGKWQQGRRCSHCARNVKPDINFIRSDFEKAEYVLHATEYTNNQQKLKYVCPNGHKHSISWNNWQQGKKCPTCKNFSKYGAGNPNWNGGISCEPYCEIWLDKEYKEDIKARDDYQCQNPFCNGNCKEKILCAHHIDYGKKNCDPWNLITLCRSCNGRANFNREYWTEFYREIMTKKYGYKYGEV